MLFQLLLNYFRQLLTIFLYDILKLLFKMQQVVPMKKMLMHFINFLVRLLDNGQKREPLLPLEWFTCTAIIGLLISTKHRLLKLLLLFKGIAGQQCKAYK